MPALAAAAVIMAAEAATADFKKPRRLVSTVVIFHLDELVFVSIRTSRSARPTAKFSFPKHFPHHRPKYVFQLFPGMYPPENARASMLDTI